MAAAGALEAARALGSYAALLAVGAALRRCGALRNGDGVALLGVAARVTLPALLLHTLPHALDLAADAPLLAALPAAGALHLLALLARARPCPSAAARAPAARRAAPPPRRI
jgi:hypothetical protein